MIRYNISRVMIAKDNKPLGIITEKDIARFLYKEMPNKRLKEVSVDEIMSTNLIKVEQQTNLNICARMMLEKKISSIVRNNHKKMMGQMRSFRLSEPWSNMETPKIP